MIIDLTDMTSSICICTAGRYPAASVQYLTVTYGHTFRADMQLLDSLRANEQDQLQLIETGQDYQIVIVFCVISSRIDADVDAAMVHVPGERTNFFSSPTSGGLLGVGLKKKTLCLTPARLFRCLQMTNLSSWC